MMHTWFEDWERACRICGCTGVHACPEIPFGEPCHWVAEDLCSACAPVAEGRACRLDARPGQAP